jgi:hypothetical protein
MAARVEARPEAAEHSTGRLLPALIAQAVDLRFEFFRDWEQPAAQFSPCP